MERKLATKTSPNLLKRRKNFTAADVSQPRL